MMIALLLFALVQDGYSQYDAWEKFGVGSWVEFKKSGGGSHKITLRKKEADYLVLHEITEVGGKTTDQTLRIDKKTASLACPFCKKTHAKQATEKEKLKVAEREFDCRKITVIQYDCDGTTVALTDRRWEHDSVPGWRLKTRIEAIITVEATLVAFEAKP